MLKAVMDRIIVRLDKPDESKFIINNNKIPQNKGVVQSVGAEVSQVKLGDHIVFHAFDELPLPMENFVVIREKSLLGVYTDEAQGDDDE